MTTSEESPDKSKPMEHSLVFRLLNPAFVVTLITFVIASLVSRGLTVAAFLPVMSDGGVPIVAAYPVESKALLLVLPGWLFFSWIVSGYAGNRQWLQITATISAFAATVVISAVLALSWFTAGMQH